MPPSGKSGSANVWEEDKIPLSTVELFGGAVVSSEEPGLRGEENIFLEGEGSNAGIIFDSRCI